MVEKIDALEIFHKHNSAYVNTGRHDYHDSTERLIQIFDVWAKYN